MVKKIFAFVVTIAIIASLCIIPTSAETPAELEGLANTLVFNVDFSTGSFLDQTGNCEAPTESTPGDDIEGSVEFVTDETLGRVVGDFKGYVLNYAVNSSDMEGPFTMEVYVNVQKQGSLGLIAGSYFYHTQNGAGFVASGFAGDKGQLGFGQGISGVVGFDGATTNIYSGETKNKNIYDQWVHLVLVHDYENKKDLFYKNGVLIGEAPSVETIYHNEEQGFRIGGYNTVDQFEIVEMRMASCRVYEEAATVEEITALYTAAQNGTFIGEPLDPNATPLPTTEPTDDGNTTTEPTDDGNKATPAPSDNSGNNDNKDDNKNDNNTTAAPTKAPAQENTQTFDLGLVSLAAVAISSAVVVKKRK